MFRLLVLILITLTLTQLISSLAKKSDRSSEDREWENYKQKYHKVYQNKKEDRFRRKIYFYNKQKVREQNNLYRRGVNSYKIGINMFSDKTLKERSRKGLLRSPRTKKRKRMEVSVHFKASGATLPPNVDWSPIGVVKDQQQCQSCYAFAVTDAIESHYALKYGKRVLLSQQQIIDCSQAEGNLGCKGGELDWTYKYIIKVGGLQLASDYPYENKDGKCRFDPSKIAVSIENFASIKKGCEKSLKEAVALYGPVSVSVSAASFDWDLYTEGVFDDPYCSNDTNHAVTVVGYGTDLEEDGFKDYWLIKNTYGDDFGMGGYMKMARNKNSQCAIANFATFPILSKWQHLLGKLKGKYGRKIQKAIWNRHYRLRSCRAKKGKNNKKVGRKGRHRLRNWRAKKGRKPHRKHHYHLRKWKAKILRKKRKEDHPLLQKSQLLC